MGRRKKFDGTQLRALRKCTPFTQEDIAAKVGISRETVSAIENNKPETMEVISIAVIMKWRKICERYADDHHNSTFKNYVFKFFGF